MCADLKNKDLLLVRWYIWHFTLAHCGKNCRCLIAKEETTKDPLCSPAGFLLCLSGHGAENKAVGSGLGQLAYRSSLLLGLLLLGGTENKPVCEAYGKKREIFHHRSCGAMCLTNNFASISCRFWSRGFLSLVYKKTPNNYRCEFNILLLHHMC